MHADAIRRHVAQRMVQHFHMPRGQADELAGGARPVHGVPAHGHVGRIDLDQQARLRQAFVFRAHAFGHRFEIGVLRRVEIIGLEQRDGAGRGGVDESFARLRRRNGRLHVGDVACAWAQGP